MQTNELEKRLTALEERLDYGWEDMLKTCTTLYDLGIIEGQSEMVAFIMEAQKKNKTVPPLGAEEIERVWEEHLKKHLQES